MNNIIINGKSYQVSGRNISVINNQVIVDGQVVKGNLTGNVHITFEGDLASLDTYGGATVKGDIHGDVDAGGSVECGNVEGSVDAGGSVRCLNVGGNIDAGGSVRMTR